jgi:hypothetical protein
MVAMISMIFGQKELDRVWRIRFDDIPKLINLISFIGAIAAAYGGPKDSRGVTNAQWGLIWAIGICTAIW